MSANDYDDPIWEYTLYTRLLPYKDAVDAFWSKVEEIPVVGTGVYALENAPPGLE